MLDQSERELIGATRDLDRPFNQDKATSRINNLAKFDETRFIRNGGQQSDNSGQIIEKSGM